MNQGCLSVDETYRHSASEVATFGQRRVKRYNELMEYQPTHYGHLVSQIGNLLAAGRAKAARQVNVYFGANLLGNWQIYCRI